MKVHYDFSLGDYRVEECVTCRLMRLTPQPGDAELEALGGQPSCPSRDAGQEQPHADELKSANARTCLRQLADYLGRPPAGDLLEIGCGRGKLLFDAAAQGLTVTGIERSAAQTVAARGTKFDFVVCTEFLERSRDPRAALRDVHALLKDDGVAMIILPVLDSLPARLMGSGWSGFSLEHFWYFSRANVKRLLYGQDFGAVSAIAASRTVSVGAIADRLKRDPRRAFARALGALAGALPLPLRRYEFPIPAGTAVLIATRLAPRSPKKLSIIMPAFNEAQTIAAGIERVLAKTVEGLDIELVVVESNSSDGTRAAVRAFEAHERVKVILQERARGKGNAVRAGFAAMTGDYVLIQDADDEYDIEDYDALLEPLISGEADFVLGARHGGGSWKMRSFTGQPLLSHVMNFGHWFFRTLINLAYGVRLKDPFTMYKVFRADCLRNLEFECNRFDFDCELVIKLVRKGYVPIEIPVNYRSRSFEEGKKVNMVRDPLTWLWAIVKFRFQKI